MPGLGRPRFAREEKFIEVILTKSGILSSFYCDACTSGRRRDSEGSR